MDENRKQRNIPKDCRGWDSESVLPSMSGTPGLTEICQIHLRSRSVNVTRCSRNQDSDSFSALSGSEAEIDVKKPALSPHTSRAPSTSETRKAVQNHGWNLASDTSLASSRSETETVVRNLWNMACDTFSVSSRCVGKGLGRKELRPSATYTGDEVTCFKSKLPLLCKAPKTQHIEGNCNQVSMAYDVPRQRGYL